MLHCIDATKTGDITTSGKIWSDDGLDRTIATAAVAGGLVYIVDIAGRLPPGRRHGQVPMGLRDQGEDLGGPLVADGKLYFGNQKMFYVMAEGREPKLLSEIKLGNPMYTTPVAANGVLYVATQHYMWAVQKKVGE